MYVYTFDCEHVKAQVDFQLPEKKDEIQYWRKHHDLHGWMEKLYYAKGGKNESFNCVPVRLTSDDLDSLEMAIVNHELPSTTGFFFGNNPPDEESDKRDLNFVDTAREAIKNEKAVVYFSWW